MQISKGEKLILLMLCEIEEHLKVQGETNTQLIKEAIFSGNLWGLEWGMPGVFRTSETPDEVVKETVDILFMWQRLEESFNSLNPEDKKWLAENSFLGEHVHFTGWDGNSSTEIEYISAAHFLVDQLDRFKIFKGRDLNAHMPTLDAYHRMLSAFEPILRQVANKDFSAAQIAEVMNAYKYPDKEGR